MNPEAAKYITSEVIESLIEANRGERRRVGKTHNGRYNKGLTVSVTESNHEFLQRMLKKGHTLQDTVNIAIALMKTFSTTQFGGSRKKDALDPWLKVIELDQWRE